MKSNGLDYTALVITIIGAVNWGLIGLFRFDLVAFLFGNLSWLSRIVYVLVGICGLYLFSLFGRIRDISASPSKQIFTHFLFPRANLILNKKTATVHSILS